MATRGAKNVQRSSIFLKPYKMNWTRPLNYSARPFFGLPLHYKCNRITVKRNLQKLVTFAAGERERRKLI